MPGVPGPVTKPWEARLGPTPPEGWPTLFEFRMKLKNQGSASGAALSAYGGVPLLFARYDIVVGDEQWNELIRILAAADGKSDGRGCGEDSEKIAAVHRSGSPRQ